MNCQPRQLPTRSFIAIRGRRRSPNGWETIELVLTDTTLADANREAARQGVTHILSVEIR